MKRLLVSMPGGLLCSASVTLEDAICRHFAAQCCLDDEPGSSRALLLAMLAPAGAPKFLSRKKVIIIIMLWFLKTHPVAYSGE